MHPSERENATLTIEFTITNESDGRWLTANDNICPLVDVGYGNTECGKNDFKKKSCEDKKWWVKFTAEDKYSGLNFIDYDGVQCRKKPEVDGNAENTEKDGDGYTLFPSNRSIKF